VVQVRGLLDREAGGGRKLHVADRRVVFEASTRRWAARSVEVPAEVVLDGTAEGSTTSSCASAWAIAASAVSGWLHRAPGDPDVVAALVRESTVLGLADQQRADGGRQEHCRAPLRPADRRRGGLRDLHRQPDAERDLRFPRSWSRARRRPGRGAARGRPAVALAVASSAPSSAPGLPIGPHVATLKQIMENEHGVGPTTVKASCAPRPHGRQQHRGQHEFGSVGQGIARTLAALHCGDRVERSFGGLLSLSWVDFSVAAADIAR